MSRGKPTPESVRTEVVRLYTVENLNIPETAARTSLPDQTVYVILKRAGVPIAKKKGRTRKPHHPRAVPLDTVALESAIRAEYAAVGAKPIADRFGVTIATVSMRAWRLGVRCENHSERSGDTRAERGDNCNQDFFRTWSPNLAWLLGYTWADGTVAREKTAHRVGYRCAIQDEHIIHDIMKAIESKATFKRFDSQPVRNGLYNGQPQIGFYISSRAVVDLLIDVYGIPPNKSNIDPPFPNIPDEWLNHFTRGLIDGDGSICPSAEDRIQVVIYGTHRFVDTIRIGIAASADIKLPNRSKHGSSEKLSRIGWSSKVDVIPLLRWLYPTGEYLYLKRKREVAERYLAANQA
jgi:hypothetical protein